MTGGPVLIAAFEGWNDAANAASDALRFLLRANEAEELRRLDFEAYFDFQAARPQVEIVNGVVRKLRWPTTAIHRAASGDRRLILVAGVEPNLRWPAFCDEILDAAAENGVETVVTLGALLGDVPHTRAIAITGTASDPRTAARLGLQRSRYEGPTGIVGVLSDASRRRGLPAVSLWAPVPAYVAHPPNPKASMALLENLSELIDIELDLRSLAVAARAWEAQVESIAHGNEELAGYIRALEERFDSGENMMLAFDDGADEDGNDEDGEDDLAIDTGDDSDDDVFDEDDLPSGESLAADFEEYLRRQQDED